MISPIKNFLYRFWKKILQHKLISLIVVAFLAWGSYSWYGQLKLTSGETQYTLTTVQKGTLISAISGTGQVSVVSQLDVKPQVAGTVVSVPVVNGQKVRAGQLLVQLDATSAQKNVRDAKTSLASAKLSLAKLQEPADQLSLTQAQNAITQAEQQIQNASSDIAQAYDSGFNQVSNVFLDLPTVVSGLDTMLNGYNLSSNQSNAYAYYDLIKNQATNAETFRDAALSSFATAHSAYDKNLVDYQKTTRFSDRSAVDALISETYNTTKLLTEAVRNAKNLLDLVNDTLTSNGQIRKAPTLLTTHQASIQSYTATTNTDLNNLLGIENTIKSDQDTITNANLTIAEKNQSLQKLQAGTDPLDIQAQQIAIEQRQNALTDAEEQLAYYSVRAPFDGIVSAVNVKVGESASGGTAVATVVTNQQIAVVSLNEVDVAKVTLGDRATLTFDALPDLTITGKVTQIDTVGTVSQNVVSYNVQIGFDTQNSEVKPGMSVSAAIVTNVKPDVLLLPTTAVKAQGMSHYVQVLDLANTTSTGTSSGNQTVTSKVALTPKTVTIGDSNDSQTEIVSGLSEGDTVVLRSSSSTATKSTNTTTVRTGGFGIPGLGGR